MSLLEGEIKQCLDDGLMTLMCRVSQICQTVQTVAWLPGTVSPILHHAIWGVVALISGEEKNTLW
jgi:predicted metal-dependent enzyme (double-stranded beta helix superfamily)